MRNVVSGLLITLGLALAGSLAFLLVAGKSKGTSAADASRQQVEAQLMRQLVHPEMTSVDAARVPTYNDFSRLLRDGVERVLVSHENLERQLVTDTDLLDRYQPDGVPGRHLSEYLRQNEAWKVSTIRASNEQIAAIKQLKGDMYAFFLSHPDEYNRIGKEFESTIAAALEQRRPIARTLTQYATGRAEFAKNPSSVTRAPFERARIDYEAWKRSE